MAFQRGDQMVEVAGGGCPDLFEVKLTVVMRDDIAHTTHGAKRQVGKQGLRLRRQPTGRFADNFEATQDSVLFLGSGKELLVRDTCHVLLDGLGGVEDVAQ